MRDQLRRVLDHPQALLIAAGTGLIIRLGLLLRLGNTPFSSDASDYFQIAVEYAGRMPLDIRHAIHWPPGIPYYLTPWMLLSAEPVVARASMLLWYALFVWLWTLLATKLVGRRAAVLGLWLFAVMPSHIYFAVEPLTSLPVAACLLAAVYLLLKIKEEQRIRDALLLGVTLGFAVLTRAGAIVLLPFSAIWVARATRKVVLAGTIWALALCVMAPRQIGLYRYLGQPLFINRANSSNFYYGNNPWTPTYETWTFGNRKWGPEVPPGFARQLAEIYALPTPEQAPRFQQAAMDHIRQRPDLFAVRTLSRIRTFWGFGNIRREGVMKVYGLEGLQAVLKSFDAGLYLALMLIAITALFAKESPILDPAVSRSIGWIVLLYQLPYTVAFSMPHYRFPLLALLALPAASAVAGWLDGAPFPRPSRLGWIVLAIFTAIQIEWLIRVG